METLTKSELSYLVAAVMIAQKAASVTNHEDEDVVFLLEQLPHLKEKLCRMLLAEDRAVAEQIRMLSL